MKKLFAPLMFSLLPLALAGGIVAAPAPAEARVVCHTGYHWESTRCVQTRNWHGGGRYVVGSYVPRGQWRDAPRARWAHYGPPPRGQRYIMRDDGNVVLIDLRGRVVRVF